MLQTTLDDPPSPAANPRELPRPERTRWQPLRVGLVELFHYDAEEFWFRDGHLLLRGNNGTGKSKVLSLTLPFLLDASLLPSRVEPDGDRGKRMEWNLLLGRYDRRIGYSWVEFGRRDDDGREHFLTLGCGLQAVAGRPRLDPPWYFVTEQRPGPELSLISAERTALSRDRLESALAGRGRIFDSAREYRREVDTRLFRLGERYAGLVDTLIQLRQPQLSKKPDEQSLSDALGNALPELARPVLEDVAEAMNQLDEYRDELALIERVQHAIGEFDRRYRVYAQIQARRQARQLRKAQTEFDNHSRVLHEARAQLEQAQSDEAAQRTRVSELDVTLLRDRAALDELKTDPSMLDARRLEDLERQVAHAERERQAATRKLENDGERLEKEQREHERRERALVRATEQRRACEAGLRTQAALAGIAADHDQAVDSLSAANAASEHAARTQLTRALERREAQLTRVREHLRRCEQRQRTHEAAQARADDRRQRLDDAAARAHTANQHLTHTATQLLAAWRAYLLGLERLSIAEPEQLLAELEAWVSALSFDQPLLAPLEAASQRAQLALATRASELALERQRLEREDAELAREQARLEAGEQLAPPPLPARDTQARRDRPGAPFWKLLEFREHVSAQDRAGIEAALEGAGLLDAWVNPEAHILLTGTSTSDAWITPGAVRSRSLLDWLTPGEGAEVDPGRVTALVASIAVQEQDDETADTWLSPRGEFRVGRLSGAHHKPEASYLGHAAREAARTQRLAELARLRTALSLQLSAADEQARQLADAQRQLTAELGRAPKDDALRDAHSQLAAAEAVRRQAQADLVEAENARELASRAWHEAQAALQQDAADLRLPSAPDELAAVERALVAYRTTLPSLWHYVEAQALSALEQSAQAERAQQAASELTTSRQAAEQRTRDYEDVAARHDLLSETKGAEIEELKRRLHETNERVSTGEAALQHAREDLSQAQISRAGQQEVVHASERTLDESSTRRKSAVEHLQGFAATGLLAVATPELATPAREQWTVDPALQLARRIEEQLARVRAEDPDWNRVQGEISNDFTTLGQAMSALGQRAVMETTDYGLIVQIVYGNRSERPDLLERHLADEVNQRRDILSAREREVLENHLQSEVAANLQRLLQEAEQRVQRINDELKRRPTSTGVYFRLEWEPLPEGDGGAPVGLSAARTRLLRRVPDAWSRDDRRVLGDFLRARIDTERTEDNTSPLIEHLARALDYRRWHRFRVKRWHDGAFRPLSGPASSGERALGLTVPLFAAASSYYESCELAHAPRLVLLDEAFAGIDDEARSHCMALIREFDLDFVMTSEREWGCYATLPGVSICQIIRREGIDGIYVSRWTWDGRERRAESDIPRTLSGTTGP